MTAVVRLGTLLGFLVLAVACGNADRPTAPSPSPPTSTVPPPSPGVPPLSVYVFNGPLSYPISDYTAASRYVFHDSRTFTLQYGSFAGDYVGTYTRENGRIAFRFSADGRWDAVGTLDGDSLEVRYNVIMELSDFENAVYRRSQ